MTIKKKSLTCVKINSLRKFLLKKFYLNIIIHPHFISYYIDDIPNERVISLKKQENGHFILDSK